jgi:hypothetical protein
LQANSQRTLGCASNHRVPCQRLAATLTLLSSFAPDNTQQRFEGTIYTFLALDANEDIYVPSRADFDALVQSMVIDSK